MRPTCPSGQLMSFILVSVLLTADSPCRYCGRTDCGCTYQMTAALLDENHLVIQEFKPEPVTLDPDSDDCSWRQVRSKPRSAAAVQWSAVFGVTWLIPSQLGRLSGTSYHICWGPDVDTVQLHIFYLGTS